MDVPEEFRDLKLYEVLECTKEADQSAIRKAYLRRCLKTHPDKPNGNELEFRKVAFAYSILGNENYRKQYDANGKLDFREDATIADLFSNTYKVEITAEMIEEDRLTYQGSDEEKADLVRFYNKYGGDFDAIFSNVIHSSMDDWERLVGVLEKSIRAGELSRTAKFTKTTKTSNRKKQQKQAAREAEEVKEDRKRLGIESEAGLAALIQKRQQQRSGLGSLIDQLEAKYAVQKPRKAKARQVK